MERLPKLPLSMTAVAVVTPSSGSNSAAMLPVVVGADMCPSLFSSHRRRADLRLLLRPGPRGAVPSASGATGARSKPSGSHVPCGERACPGATTEDRPSRGASGGWPGSRATGAARGRGPTPGCPGSGPLDVLAAQAESLDERAVPSDVGLRQVVQQAAATSDQQEQAPPAVVVVLVHLQVLGEVADPTGQHRDLHLGRAGVVLDRGVLGHDLLLERALQRHGSPPGRVTCGPRSGSRGQVSHRWVAPAAPRLPADVGAPVRVPGAGAAPTWCR